MFALVERGVSKGHFLALEVMMGRVRIFVE